MYEFAPRTSRSTTRHLATCIGTGAKVLKGAKGGSPVRKELAHRGVVQEHTEQLIRRPLRKEADATTQSIIHRCVFPGAERAEADGNQKKNSVSEILILASQGE